jgi:hypothetical protein
MKDDSSSVLDRIEHHLPADPDAFRRLEERRDRRVMRRRVAAGGVGIGLTVALALVVILAGSDDVPPTIPVSTGDPNGLPTAKPGEYYYVRIKNGMTTNERWYSPDGSGRFVTRLDGVVVDDRSFAVGELTSKISDLPVEPSAVVEQLSERSAPGGPSPIAVETPDPDPDDRTRVLMAMADLLGFGSDHLVPQQSAAIFRASSGSPDVQVDRRRDPVGRDAISVAWNFRDRDSVILVRWYFEPSTLQFMGEQMYDSATGGAEMARSVIWMAGITDSTDAVPRPSERYVPAPS